MTAASRTALTRSTRSQPHAPVLVGRSDATRRLRADIDGAARSTAEVLIVGETGTGKEVAARLVHERGRRRHQQFVAMNCSGMPDTLLGPALARAAAGGTLFMDEVGEMSMRMPSAVVRFLETGDVQPAGASASSQAAVRLIAATRRDLRAQIGRREFREDLFYRLNVIQIAVPPLRERGDDIGVLFRHYLEDASAAHGVDVPAVSPHAEARLHAYRWPGNVRELKNVAERLVLQRHGRQIRERDLPSELLSEHAAGTAPHHPLDTRGHRASDAAWMRLMKGEGFWTAVHAGFEAHDMTRADLRAIVRRGLERTRGNYRELVRLFHMESRDYRRFLSFLDEHDCHVPFEPRTNAVPSRPALICAAPPGGEDIANRMAGGPDAPSKGNGTFRGHLEHRT